VQDPPEQTHLDPDPQQCIKSEQQQALAKGQQPAPVAVRQQVSPVPQGFGEQGLAWSTTRSLLTGLRAALSARTTMRSARMTETKIAIFIVCV